VASETKASTGTDRKRAAIFQYFSIMALLALCVIGVVVMGVGATPAVEPRLVVRPMLALFAITFVVWILIPLSRHWAGLTGRATLEYLRTFRGEKPAEWIERPARVYDNLMQAPTLFYVMAILMLVTPWADETQLRLAWLFVGLRLAHAGVYLAANHLLLRFAAFALSSAILWVMWARYAVYSGVL